MSMRLPAFCLAATTLEAVPVLGYYVGGVCTQQSIGEWNTMKPSSMQEIECPHCEAVVNVRDDLAGKSVRCPKCKGTFDIPDDEDEGELVAMGPVVRQPLYPPIFQWIRVCCWVHLVSMCLFTVLFLVSALILTIFTLGFGLPSFLGLFFIPLCFLPGFWGLGYIEIAERRMRSARG
jgi:predicted Zn finger-like uncharacterized protein